MEELPYGIDFSKHQGINNFAKIKANTAFVFIKATESWGYTDPKFVANWQGMAGHKRGAYSYIWLSDDPLRQANHLINTVTNAGVDWRYDRLVLDLEKSGHGLSKAEVSRRVIVMMERIKEVTGRYPILYSRADWVNNNMLVTDPRIANADWWFANYLKPKVWPQFTPEKSPPPLLPRGVGQWLIHQAGERGNGGAVGVGSYYVDENRWNTANQEIEAFFGLREEAPPTDPEPPNPPDLDEAIVVTVKPNRLKTRHTPGGIERPEEDWLQSGQKVQIYEEVPEWWRVGENRWSMAKYLQKIMSLPLFNVQLWSQKDPRWAKDKMGSSNITLEEEGCLVTITSVELNFLGIDTDPKKYNAALTNLHGYKSPNLMYWQMPAIMWPSKIAMKEYQWFNNGTGWEPLAESIVASGRPVLAQVRSTPMQHWVLLLGKLNNLWYCLDPLYGTVSALTDKYSRVYRIASYTRR